MKSFSVKLLNKLSEEKNTIATVQGYILFPNSEIIVIINNSLWLQISCMRNSNPKKQKMKIVKEWKYEYKL